MTNCLFCKIASGEIPAKIAYQDDDFVVFHDINPSAPVHLLMIPRQHVTSLQTVTESDVNWLGRMMIRIPQIALDNGCNPGAAGGFRVLVNSGKEGGQEVGHLHVHIMGGARPWSGRTAINV
jgi:histidine triad (HIT) family protein